MTNAPEQDLSPRPPAENRLRNIGLALGPLVFLLIGFTEAGSLQGPARFAAAVTAWMAAWWITEAIPLAVTALLPIVLFPLTGVLGASEVTRNYGHPLIFLFLGGFVLSAALQRWNLHRRIALRIILAVGPSPQRLVLGFMLATGFLSMWISNSATAMMMVPIGAGVIRQVLAVLEGNRPPADGHLQPSNFALSLMLSIAYASSIGGIATIIGSPPNAIFVGYVETAFGQSITFFQWLLYGTPIAVAGLLLAWVYLTRIAFPPEFPELPGGVEAVRTAYRSLGPMTRAEIRVAAIFGTVAFLWIARGFVEPWLSGGLIGVTDTSVAIFGALLLFLIPSGGTKGGTLLTWEDVQGISWGVLILFGGGLALAQGIENSGAAQWAAEQLSVLRDAPSLVVTLAVVALVIFLTEVTSNTSVATIFMPVMAGAATGIGMHPYLLMITAATAASCAFMLPVATPPNAIVFGTGHVPLRSMAKAGFWLNLMFIVIITAAAYWWLPRAWGL